MKPDVSAYLHFSPVFGSGWVLAFSFEFPVNEGDMARADCIERETAFVGPAKKMKYVSVVGFSCFLVSDAGDEKFEKRVGGFFTRFADGSGEGVVLDDGGGWAAVGTEVVSDGSDMGAGSEVAQMYPCY